MEYFYTYQIWGNTMQKYFVSFCIIFFGIALVKLFKKTLLSKIKKLVSTSDTKIDDFIIEGLDQYGIPSLKIYFFYFGINNIIISPKFHKIILCAYLLSLSYYFINFIIFLIEKLILTYIAANQQVNISKSRQISSLMLIFRLGLWILAALVLLNTYLGYDITAILTGLGVGGIAIALATQNILGDLFNYFVIFFDRPFEIDDFIQVDDKKGVVENIGLKTTRIKSVSGEQIVISNSSLTSSKIHNFKRLKSRRVIFNIGIVYTTPTEKLKNIPHLLKKIIEKVPLSRFDRVHLTNFGSASLVYEVVFFVDTDDYNIYMDLLHNINLSIIEEFKNNSIELFYNK
jgi:small-conductance mechanosensitive channel